MKLSTALVTTGSAIALFAGAAGAAQAWGGSTDVTPTSPPTAAASVDDSTTSPTCPWGCTGTGPLQTRDRSQTGTASATGVPTGSPTGTGPLRTRDRIHVPTNGATPTGDATRAQTRTRSADCTPTGAGPQAGHQGQNQGPGQGAGYGGEHGHGARYGQHD